ncbi:MAG TPA: YidC/Oxa1 family membrane protein insertase [Candidatus Eisenbacteria bacterium]|nr:YidC/Oxa1 family membrane protein insertase [Candidatus Eisenbacteria bacterium]
MNELRQRMARLRRVDWVPLLRVATLLAIALVILAACLPTGEPGGSGAPTVAPVPTALYPAELKPDPLSVLSWAFTPIFQAFFLLLVAIDQVVPDIGIAIIVTTLIVRTGLVPLMRRQMVSMRQMQAIQPEIKEIQRRFKGDRLKAQQAQAELMKERGISQAGCLMAILPLLLILPMYQVVLQLASPDPTPMLSVFGVQLIHLDCDLLSGRPCLAPTIPWLGGIPANGFEGFIPLPIELPIIGVGISIFAILYTVLQLVASRMALPPHAPGVVLDQQARMQRSMSLYLPFITLLYGSLIPVGVFLYLIVSTAYQIGQQFFTTGWGGMFPLFGRTPAFAVDHQPRFPVAAPAAPQSSARPAGTPGRPKTERSTLDRTASANATIRQRGRQGRRGRRR